MGLKLIECGRYQNEGLADGTVRVFSNTPSLLARKWNDDAMQAALSVGRFVGVTAHGFRNPNLDLYPNITHFEGLGSDDCPDVIQELQNK